MLFQYPHTRKIPKRPRGTLGKCEEELEELHDAHTQQRTWHVCVEAADLINSTYSFVWKTYRVPFFVVLLLAMCTGLYKPVLRWLKKRLPVKVLPVKLQNEKP